MTFEDTYEECSEITLGDTVYVTDPCYTPDIWCCNKVEGVKPGHYQTAITKNNEDRVACIGIYHEAANDDTVWEKAPFEVGVDSGQAGVFDAEYFEKNFGGDYDDPKSFYGECCALTLAPLGFGSLENGKGFVSCSGYGDGGYDLNIGRNDKGEIIAFEIPFILDDEEEDGDEDEWDEDDDWCDEDEEDC